jgi:hypothetical protein
MLFLLLACAPTPDSGGKTNAREGREFQHRDSVNVSSPTNGESVDSPFTLRFTTGADVAAVHLEVDGDVTVTSTPVEDGEGSLVVTLDPGRQELALVGEDADGNELNRHEFTIRVTDPDVTSWVTISSPSDGAEVTNPVTFAVSASSDIDHIDLLADDWHIGSVDPGGVFTYTFTGTGYAREIRAEAWAGNDMVATDSLEITVDPGTEPTTSSFNDYVLATLETYPTDGTDGYYWPEADGVWWGTSRDVYYRGELMSPGDPQGRCYCVGLTWEVFLRSWQEVDRMSGGDGTVNGISADEMRDEFRADWFVRELWGMGPVDALENYGLGERVTNLEDVQPGDFIQFWRHSGTGHNNIFISWLRDDAGNIEGIRYWSTQSSTDGIGYHEEYFGSSGSSIDPSYFFAARMFMPEDWIPWN